jgi:hypothetical protein
MHNRVEIPDGSHMLVPEGGDEGADEDVHYVVVEQDLDQRPEGPKANLANEGKPGSLTHVLFKFIQLSFLCLCIYVSGVDMKL